MPTIEARVKEIIKNNLCVKQEEVSSDAKFMEDLGADSLDLIELSMAIEEEFEGEMTDEEAREILTVGQLVEYVEKKVAEAKTNNSKEWRG